MKKRIAIIVSGLLVFLIAYAFLGSYGVHEEECIKCGAWRTQFRIGSVTVLSVPRETEVSEWYSGFDPNHEHHSWGSVCGAVHTWFRGRPRWVNYDNFGWSTAIALHTLHERQTEMPDEEFNTIMTNFVATDVASITGGLWRLPKTIEEESQPVGARAK
jgi:hypothetical protein